MSIDSDFMVLTGNSPFPWQRALFDRFMANDFPKACDLPTGLGKTSVIAIWLLALAANPTLPRRLVYVVNRRTVVDQSTAEAELLRRQLHVPEAEHLRRALTALAAVKSDHPVAISTLRGEFADNAEWRQDPSRPAIIVGTVDMIGSRLLFSGYGCGFKTKPLHAGFLGQDTLLVHDEAHLEPAFQQLIESIGDAQKNEARSMRVIALSATVRVAPDFTLSADDEKDPVVRARLTSKKGLAIHNVIDKKLVAPRAAELALTRSGAVLVYLSTVENVEQCAASLRKAVGKEYVQILTGTLRGHERDALISDSVFARFQPPKSRRVEPRSGTVFLVSTSAGEVGIDISADHMVTDLPTFDALAQRLGRLNRYGDGDSFIDVIAEPLEAKPLPKGESANGDGSSAEKDAEDGTDSGRSEKEYEWARFATGELLKALPDRKDGYSDVSPAALRALPPHVRVDAYTPLPQIPAVDELLLDRWSYTTIRRALPGRPPVDDWLHGVAEWEPPRTTVAWRREVAWLSDEHLGNESIDDFLADYPLRAREKLTDRTERVTKQLKKIAERDEHCALRAWLVRDGQVESYKRNGQRCLWWRLVDLLEAHGPKQPLLDNAVVLLSPEAGGLNEGLLDGAVAFDVERAAQEYASYDLGTLKGERHVDEDGDEDVVAPEGMRLVRAIKRSEGDDENRWWRLFARQRVADDEGSCTGPYKQTLGFHLLRTEAWAAAITDRLHVPQPERDAIVRAARWHDLGKARRVWQRSIKNFEYPARVYAKGRVQPSALSHYRHELGSLHDVEKIAGFAALTAETRDLTLHLIAAHHGRARPFFAGDEAIDPEVKDAQVATTVAEVPLRFDRLQRKYGRWGLAWLESILRAADYLASDEEEAT